jgi:5-methylcytosine-specific restriction endonuclease McrA
MTGHDLKKLSKAGLSAEQISIVAAMIEKKLVSNVTNVTHVTHKSVTKGLSRNALRQRRFREKKYVRIHEKCGYKCYYCGVTENLTIEHVIPLSRGGKDDYTNLVSACESCNKSKGGRTIDEWKNNTGGRHGKALQSVTQSVTDELTQKSHAHIENVRAPDSLFLPSEVESKKESKKEKNLTKKGSVTETVTLPEWIPLPDWNAWLQIRKRGTNTPHALNLAIKKIEELSKQGYAPQSVLQNCILNGWQGIYPPKGNGTQPEAQKQAYWGG